MGKRINQSPSKINLGPGQYEAKKLNTGPIYTIQEKIKTVMKPSPGPGDYEKFASNIVLKSAPSYK